MASTRKRRNNILDSYRYHATYKKIESTKVNPGFMQTVEFEEVGTRISYGPSDGKGLTKTEFQLFQNWIVQSGKRVIETPELLGYAKGELIVIDGKDNLISEIIELKYDNRRLRGDRKNSQSETRLLFIG